MEFKGTTVTTEYWYSSEAERNAHAKKMIASGYEDCGQVRAIKSDVSVANAEDSDYSWYGRYSKVFDHPISICAAH